MVGLEAKNRILLHKRFICLICSLIIQDPMQLMGCGHRLCRSCLSTFEEITIECPKCLTRTPRNQVMIDRGFQKDMQSLPIECFCCCWIGVLNDYQDHLNRRHSNLKCEHCGMIQCEKITIDCLLKELGCDEQIGQCDMSNHYSSEQHQNLLLKYSQLMQSQMENESKSSMKIGVARSPSISVMAVDPVTVLFREMCEFLNIPLEAKNLLSDGEQRRLNDALYQYQKKYPTLTLEFFAVKLSVEVKDDFSETMKTIEDILNKDFASLNEIDDLQYASYNETLI